MPIHDYLDCNENQVGGNNIPEKVLTFFECFLSDTMYTKDGVA
jgi:hypothetical protein